MLLLYVGGFWKRILIKTKIEHLLIDIFIE